jgi:transposase-like protein
MKTVIKFNKNIKRKPVIHGKEKEVIEIDSRIEMIQALIPIGLKYVQEVLEEEVSALAGAKHSRAGGQLGHDRWGSNKGSVYLGEQKVSIDVPRVRDLVQNQEVPLSSYQKLQEPRQADDKLLLKVLRGLSCRSYESCAETVPEVFGMSASTISRRFKAASAKRLKQLSERDLSKYDLVAMFLDGKYFGEDEMIVALGVTIKGDKVMLGFVQAGTENERVCREFLRGLVDRGLKYQQGLLCVMDGSKGLKASVSQVFGYHARIQRCQWHKRENIVRYLPKSKQVFFRNKLSKAYALPTYAEVKSALLKIRQELEIINVHAVASLDEGMEETLTLHRLGLFEVLGESFKTTNCLESLNAQLGQRTDKVDYWVNSGQKQRWVATALLDIEPALRKVKGYRHLPLLRSAIANQIQQTEEKKNKKVA